MSAVLRMQMPSLVNPRGYRISKFSKNSPVSYRHIGYQRHAESEAIRLRAVRARTVVLGRGVVGMGLRGEPNAMGGSFLESGVDMLVNCVVVI
jgi:hypothetical protein